LKRINPLFTDSPALLGSCNKFLYLAVKTPRTCYRMLPEKEPDMIKLHVVTVQSNFARFTLHKIKKTHVELSGIMCGRKGIEYYRASPEDQFKMRASSPKRQSFFFRKREKAIAFSFSIKRNLYSSCSRIYSSIVKT
jgi:hypothetical protein